MQNEKSGFFVPADVWFKGLRNYLSGYGYSYGGSWSTDNTPGAPTECFNMANERFYLPMSTVAAGVFLLRAESVVVLAPRLPSYGMLPESGRSNSH